MTPRTPVTATVLDALSRERLFDLGRVFGAALPATKDAKAVVAKSLTHVVGDDRLVDVLRELGRDELRALTVRRREAVEGCHLSFADCA